MAGDHSCEFSGLKVLHWKSSAHQHTVLVIQPVLSPLLFRPFLADMLP